MRITIKDFEYLATPEQLAEELCEMYEVCWARFFNKIGEIFSNTKNSLPMQLQYMIESKKLTHQGVAAMRLIGHYGSSALENHYLTDDTKEEI